MQLWGSARIFRRLEKRRNVTFSVEYYSRGTVYWGDATYDPVTSFDPNATVEPYYLRDTDTYFLDISAATR